MGMLVFAGRRRPRGQAAIAPFRALADAARRHGPADGLPGDVPAGGRVVPPDRGRTNDVHRPGRSTTVATIIDRTSSAIGRRRCGSPSCGCSAGRWPACPSTRPRSRTAPAGSWSTSRRSTRARRTRRPGAAWVDGVRARPCDQGDDGAYVNFLGDEGAARVRAAYPGATWDRLAADQGTLRPGQPVPPQPEHPARGRLTAPSATIAGLVSDAGGSGPRSGAAVLGSASRR